jgi:hypothetical protein
MGAEATTPAAGPAPLLPNGAVLNRADGVMVRKDEWSPWTLRLIGDAADPRGRARDFVLLPNRVLEDMEHRQSQGKGNPTFTVSGDVTLFEGRNWLMPRHAEVQTTAAPRAMPEATQPDPDNEMRRGTAEGDSVADIVAELQRSVPSIPTTVDRGSDAESREGPLDGTLILSRRGRLLRGRHGAWIFVYDADAWGGQDEPAVLLPSPVLTKLIRAGRRSDYRDPVLLSGSLSRYRDHTFLVPTGITEFKTRPNLSR